MRAETMVLLCGSGSNDRVPLFFRTGWVRKVITIKKEKKKEKERKERKGKEREGEERKGKKPKGRKEKERKRKQKRKNTRMTTRKT